LPASARALTTSGRQFFKDRSKALIEALLSDLVIVAHLSPTKCTLDGLADGLALREATICEELRRIHEESSSPRAHHLAG
jgi:type IV secretion system protein VirD4